MLKTNMAAPMDSGGNNQNPHLIDDLENGFLSCLSLLTSQEYFNVQDPEETKTSIENSMQKFLALSRQTEAFFLRKKMLVTFQKPDMYLSDDTTDLRTELMKKEQLLEKHMERLKKCQMMLPSNPGVGQPFPQPHPAQSQAPPTSQSTSHTLPVSTHGGGAMSQFPTSHHGNLSQMNPPGAGQGGPGTGHYGGNYQGPPMHATSQMAGGPSPMQQPHSMGMGMRPQAPPSYSQGPLAFLEQTTSNIGMPDRR